MKEAALTFFASRKRVLQLIFILLLIWLQSYSQPPLFRTYNYVSTYAEHAIEQMVLARIPASVTLAQAIFESRCGSSELAERSNNHFGIKCHWQWCGDTVLKNDDSENECFRKYSSVAESYADHSSFLRTRPWYAPLFSLPLSDYKSWCKGLKEAGYATFPEYADKLISIIEELQLYELDRCERLLPAQLPAQPEPDLKTSPLLASAFSVQQFAEHDLLWMEAGDIHIRSLLLLLARQESHQFSSR